LTTDFRSRTTPELTRLYNGMSTTASDLGMPHERQTEFASPEALIAACEALEQQITEFRAGLNTSDEAQTGSPGLRRLRSHPEAEAIRQATLADNAGARAEAVHRIEEEKTMSDTATAPAAAEGAPKKAKKAKTAKTAKKAAAPKKAAAKAAGAGRAGAIPDDAKITVSAAVLKENPRRKGTGQFDRMAVLIKHHGKTVGEYMKKGERPTLNHAVERGEVKVSKGG
jgi:hypothetical protein